MNSQFKKGVVEMCLLKLISQSKMTAYDLLYRIATELEVNENTVYPILRRLEMDGDVTVEKVMQTIGAPRKLFSLTSKGQATLDTMVSEWRQLSRHVIHILGGESHD